MEKFLNLFVSGAVSGAVYSLIAAGLVLSFSATGIFNLGYGAVAFTTAYVYYELHIGLGWGIVPSAFVSILVFAPLLGLAMNRFVFRPLAQASDTAKVMATVGILVAAPSIPRFLVERLVVDAHWTLPLGTDVYGPPGLGPSPKYNWRLPGNITIDSDQAIVAGLAVLVGLGLWVLLRHTRLGLRMRAVVESPGLASLRGVDPGRSTAVAWALGSLLAGLAGVAAAPIFNSLQPGTYTAIVFVATAAAVFGGLRSVPLAFVGGVLLGVLQNLVTGYVSFTKEIAGFGQAVPFLVLLGGLLVMSRKGARRAGSIAEDRPRDDHRLDLPAWRRRLPWVIATALLVIYVQFVADDLWVGLTARGMALGLVFLSFVIVSGQGGMVSLAQGALVTAAGLSAGVAIDRYHLPFLVGVLVGMAVAALIGALVALPAMRLGGLSLTLATLSLALLGDNVLFAWPWLRNGQVGWSMERPSFGPVDLASDKTFALFTLVIVLLVVWLIHNLARSASGRAMAAARASEVAAATSGISLVGVKLRLLVLSSAIAGLGGVFLVTFDFHATNSTYTTGVGLAWVATVVLWGVRRPGAAVIAGLSASLFPALLSNGFHFPAPIPTWFDWNGTQSVFVPDILFGLGAIQMAKDPDGILALVGGRRREKRAKAAARRPTEAATSTATATVRPTIGTTMTATEVVASTAAPVLRVRNLRAAHGELDVLHGVDIALDRGTITVLLGANGAGKSTLCSVLGGLVPASSGTIELEGQDVTGQPAHRRAVGGLLVLPESRGIFPGLTVEENLSMWLPSADQRAEAYDRFPALGQRLRLPAGNLSGGEQQMVTLAAACVRPPTVLVADEPTLGLAPLVVEEVLRSFAILRDEGVTCLLIEEKSRALEVADRAALLELGHVAWAGAAADVDRDQLAAIHLGRTEVPGMGDWQDPGSVPTGTDHVEPVDVASLEESDVRSVR